MVLRRLRHLLRPGGLLVLNQPNLDSKLLDAVRPDVVPLAAPLPPHAARPPRAAATGADGGPARRPRPHVHRPVPGDRQRAAQPAGAGRGRPGHRRVPQRHQQPRRAPAGWARMLWDRRGKGDYLWAVLHAPCEDVHENRHGHSPASPSSPPATTRPSSSAGPRAACCSSGTRTSNTSGWTAGPRTTRWRCCEPYVDRFAYFVSERDKGQSDAIHRGLRSGAPATSWRTSTATTCSRRARCTGSPTSSTTTRRSTRSTATASRSTGRTRCIWYWILPEHSDWYMTRWDLIPQETCFWRRRIFEKCGNVDPTFRFAIDYDLFVRFMQRGPDASALDRFLGVFREHEAAKTSRCSKPSAPRRSARSGRATASKRTASHPHRQRPLLQRRASAAGDKFAAGEEDAAGVPAGRGVRLQRGLGRAAGRHAVAAARRSELVRMTRSDAA